MDKNKLKKLRTINYKISACGLCKHGSFTSGDRESYGTCGINTYNHIKHTGEPRQLSVYWFGHCEDFKKDETNYRASVQEGWEEFIDPGSYYCQCDDPEWATTDSYCENCGKAE